MTFTQAVQAASDGKVVTLKGKTLTSKDGRLYVGSARYSATLEEVSSREWQIEDAKPSGAPAKKTPVKETPAKKTSSKKVAPPKKEATKKTAATKKSASSKR